MIFQAISAHIEQAATLLHQGELVAFPTETVFGLGANALSDTAVQKLYAVKGRDFTNPCAIMVASIEQAERIAQVNHVARDLMQAFWPGPISIVLPYRIMDGVNISPRALAGLSTISLRMPSHPVALALLLAANIPLAVPSANRSGQLSTTRALDVAQNLGDEIPMILADATRILGLESTIIDVSGKVPKILRMGAITPQEIESVIGHVEINTPSDSGTHKNFTLKTPLRLKAVDVKQGEAFLGFGKLNYIGVEKIGFVRDMPDSHWRNLSADGDLDRAAANLYQMLAELDDVGADCIAVMAIPNIGLGVTINDRLQRCVQPVHSP